jgi:enoyl-CoA hydratase
MSAVVLVDRSEGVGRVTLNRPEKRNALSLEVRELLVGAFEELAADDGVGCLLLTGAGTAFCAGMDVTEFGGDRAQRERIVELSVAALGGLARFPKPAVAAVNGPAVAGGFALALYCDVRIGSEAARLGFAEPPGIPPSYAAARSALPAPLARELTLTGRIVHAQEAVDVGLLSEMTEPERLMPRATELAAHMAARPASGITKRRILLEREHLFGPLFEEEERLLRQSLLGE